MKKSIPYISVILAMFFWSASYIVIKFAYNYMTPLTLTFLRMVFASIFMPVLYFLLPQRDRISRGDLKDFMLLAFFEPFLYFIGESNGVMYVPASYASIIIALIPLVTPFFAWMLIKERITKWGIAGAVISFSGAGLLAWGDTSGEVQTKGILFLALAVLAAIAYGIKLRQVAFKFKPVTIVTIQTILGMLYFFPVFLIFNGKQFFADLPPLVAYYPVTGLALFCTCGSFLLYTSAVRKIGLNNANIFNNSIPIFTTILAYIYLKEAVNAIKIAGILIVVGGLFLSQFPNLRRNRT